MKPTVGGVNKIEFSWYLYTQVYHKLHTRSKKIPPVFFLVILFILTVNGLWKSAIES